MPSKPSLSRVSLTLLALILSLATSPVQVTAIQLHPRHGGRSHPRPRPGHALHQRQLDPHTIPSAATEGVGGGNGPAEGVGILSLLSPAPVPTSPPPRNTNASNPPPPAAAAAANINTTDPVPSIVAIAAAAGLNNLTSTSTSNIGSSTTSTGITGLFTFPSSVTVLQVPIATVCPPASNNGNASSPSTAGVFQYAKISLSTLSPTNGTVGAGVLNATAVLPGGVTATYLTTSRASTTTTSSAGTGTGTGGGSESQETGRIMLGNNGCQTLLSAKTTTFCSTIITLPGQLPVSVSECSQWVTFSSAPATTQVSACGGTATTAAAGVASQGEDGGAASASTGAAAPASEFPTLSSSSGKRPGIFYASPWHLLAPEFNNGNSIPNLVRVDNCPANLTGEEECSTHHESWGVTTRTSSSVYTSVLSFSGPAVMSHPSGIMTTMLSVESTSAGTHTWAVEEVVRSRHADDGSSTDVTRTTKVEVPSTSTVGVEEAGKEPGSSAASEHETATSVVSHTTVTVRETVTQRGAVDTSTVSA